MSDAAKVAAEMADDPSAEADVLRAIIKNKDAEIERLREAVNAALCNDCGWWKTAEAALDGEGQADD